MPDTTIDGEVEARILTFMSDNLHIILEDEGDQSEIPRSKFAKDLAAQLTNLIAQEANKAYEKGRKAGIAENQFETINNFRKIDGLPPLTLEEVGRLTADKEQA